MEWEQVEYCIKEGYYMAIFTFINMIVFAGFMFIGIYCFVLFVKLANKGIEALDIYINEKKNKL